MEQAQNPEKNIEIKYPDGDQLFIGYADCSLLEFSMIGKKSVYDFGEVLDRYLFSLEKTLDNKSQFVCGYYGEFREFDISTRKKVNSFTVESARCCVVSHDNKFLITVEYGYNYILTKWSVRTKKQLHT